MIGAGRGKRWESHTMGVYIGFSTHVYTLFLPIESSRDTVLLCEVSERLLSESLVRLWVGWCVLVESVDWNINQSNPEFDERTTNDDARINVWRKETFFVGTSFTIELFDTLQHKF